MCENDRFGFLNSLILAVLVGFLVGLLVYLGIISDVTIPLIITIVSAFVISIAFFSIIVMPRYYKCIRKYSCIILIGIIGAIIFSTIAFSIDITTNLFSSIIIGLVVFFISYLIIEFIKLLTCIINKNEWINDSFNNQLNNTNSSIDDTLNIENNNLESEIEKNTRYCKYNKINNS